MEGLVNTTLSQTVGQMVAEKPSRAAVFERVGIDFWGGGQLTLDDACRNRGLSISDVLSQLKLADSNVETVKDDCAAFGFGALCDHVVARHHSYLRREMPRIGTLLFRVAEAHSERHPELRRLLELYTHFAGDLKRHIDVEEEVLFPMIRQLEAGIALQGGSPGRIEMLTEDLANEHELAGAVLSEVRMLTRDFSVPGDACDTYKLVLMQLAEFERDMREHVGIENNILYPKACHAERMLG
jgi:regulator of cell morphogenesis and NO signaling